MVAEDGAGRRRHLRRRGQGDWRNPARAWTDRSVRASPGRGDGIRSVERTELRAAQKVRLPLRQLLRRLYEASPSFADPTSSAASNNLMANSRASTGLTLAACVPFTAIETLPS